MLPFVLTLRLARPEIPVFYMIRGDEATYVQQHGRWLRAKIAVLFQKALMRLGCHFVLVSEDLRALFEKRLGPIRPSYVLPNTLGKQIPPVRTFDGTLALVGHFNSVKNIEWAIKNLGSGRFHVHLFGNYDHPEEWRRPWLQSHGFVEDLPNQLRRSCSLVILSCTSAGFPNVALDALEAGCGIVVHRGFPFKYLPIHEAWRFDTPGEAKNVPQGQCGNPGCSDLERVLERLLRERRDFKVDNPEIIKLVESRWEDRVWSILG
jgi:glycosyltransferase involved in cell wall biosynthesis